MSKLHHYFLEPMNTLTHLMGAVASLAGTLILGYLTRQQPGKFVTMLVYGLSMTILYVSSSLLHGIKTDDAKRMWLNRLDHIAIFLLIAGTYTPIAYNLFPARVSWPALVFIWVAVIMGALYKLFSPRIHGWVNASIYVFLGWGSAVPLLLSTNLLAISPPGGLALLLFGGLIYTMGFFIYYFRWPDPWPDFFGHHEIWHIFVMGGSLCHFLFILFFVVP
ncbi:MAG: hemolysin III family protein [Ardenticatenaceae bacterium]|nr:hemolysin III family protein [Ardenticatenaceae bacterium]